MLIISRIIIGLCSVSIFQGPQTIVSVRTEEDRLSAARLLESGKLAPEVESRTIVSLAEFLNPSDGEEILYAYRSCVKRRPGCIDAVVPQMVNSIKTTKSETFFCLLCDTLMHCDKIPPASMEILLTQFERRQDFDFGSYKLAAVFVRFGQTDKLVWLGSKLKSSGNMSVVCAAEALGSLGTRAKSMIPKLEPLLEALSPGVRVTAASALWKIGYRDKREVIEKVLRASLSEEDEVVAVEPTFASDIGSEIVESHRDVAIFWLGEIGSQSAETADIVASMLRDASNARKLRIIHALAKIGKRTDSTLAALRDASVDQKNAPVASEARRALKLIEQR